MLIIFQSDFSIKAKEAGLPPPVETADTRDTILHVEQSLLATIHSEDLVGQTKAEMDTSHNLADQVRKQMSSFMTNQIVSMFAIILFSKIVSNISRKSWNLFFNLNQEKFGICYLTNVKKHWNLLFNL